MAKKFEQIFWEPFMQVRHSCIIFYSLPSRPLTHSRHTLNYKTYSGKSTSGASKRIKKAVDLLLQLSPPTWITNTVTSRQELHTLSFITLTIPGGEKRLTASEGHKLLLAPWLLRMKRKHGMKTYIWKAEFQKNGQLHYHITTPSWIPYYSIRDEWNNIMSGAGMLADWQSKHASKMPNSTDVHKVYKVDNIQAYLSKYLAKNDQDKETKGKIWDCSMNLKKNKFFTHPEPSDRHRYIKHTQIEEINRCGIFKAKNPVKFLPGQIQSDYKKYLSALTAEI